MSIRNNNHEWLSLPIGISSHLSISFTKDLMELIDKISNQSVNGEDINNKVDSPILGLDTLPQSINLESSLSASNNNDTITDQPPLTPIDNHSTLLSVGENIDVNIISNTEAQGDQCHSRNKLQRKPPCYFNHKSNDDHQPQNIEPLPNQSIKPQSEERSRNMTFRICSLKKKQSRKSREAIPMSPTGYFTTWRSSSKKLPAVHNLDDSRYSFSSTEQQPNPIAYFSNYQEGSQAGTRPIIQNLPVIQYPPKPLKYSRVEPLPNDDYAGSCISKCFYTFSLPLLKKSTKNIPERSKESSSSGTVKKTGCKKILRFFRLISKKKLE